MTTENTNPPAKTSRITIQDIKDAVDRQRAAWDVVHTFRHSINSANTELAELKAKRNEIAGDDVSPLSKVSKSLAEHDSQITVSGGRIDRVNARLHESIGEAAELSRASVAPKIEQAREALYDFRRNKEADKIAAFLCKIGGSSQTVTEYESFIKTTAYDAAGIAASLACFDEGVNAYKINMDHRHSEPAFEAVARLILENAAELEEALEWKEKINRALQAQPLHRHFNLAEFVELPKAA